MNINQAKEYIKNSIKIYLKKDEFGDYRIPVVRQRPIFLLGAPGIGKTAIMEQIAEEMGIALVSYSMTHHTRQSALGLPFIKEKCYGNRKYDVSEYTMSEIISTIYETMEESGVREGILFLDEINCVSETLAPSMLQFLQYKVFGKHQVPEGWIIVTAGNPPEYNKSVREFDVVTMDRLKVLSVEADFATWKSYAQDKGVLGCILSFLEIKKEFFYLMETTVKGRSYVTARGWEDLSDIILMYEEEGLKVDEALVGQYINNEKVVKEFCAYYDLYNKYKKDYRIEDILRGNVAEATFEKVRNATFDERLSLVSMLLDNVLVAMKDVVCTSDFLNALMPPLRAVKEASDVYDILDTQIEGRKKLMKNLERANSLSATEKRKHNRVLRFMQDIKKHLMEKGVSDKEVAFEHISKEFNEQVADMKDSVSKTDGMLHNLFEFTVKAFGEEKELLILVTELTAGETSSRYIGMFGCEDYNQYSDKLMVSKRREDIREAISKLELV